jgi:SAM-dependent methyltransferase
MNRSPDSPKTVRTTAGDLSSDDFIRYLAAKKSVDDRALNRTVWRRLKACLPPSTQRKPLQVIEFGAGIGTMFERVLEWGLMPHLHYTMVEINADYLTAFWSGRGANHPDRLRPLQRRRKEEAGSASKHGTNTVETLCADLYDVVADPQAHGQYDLIIAHAVMDLVNVADVLSGFASMTRPGGLLYLSLVYDGHTTFLPAGDPEFERELFDRYHCSMDRREDRGKPSGGSRAGRSLFGHLAALDLRILAAGASDWIVYPQSGRYAAEEAHFLDRIIETINRELHRDTAVDPRRLAEWAAWRHAQVQAGELIFMAGNLDFLARKPAL